MAGWQLNRGLKYKVEFYKFRLLYIVRNGNQLHWEEVNTYATLLLTPLLKSGFYLYFVS